MKLSFNITNKLLKPTQIIKSIQEVSTINKNKNIFIYKFITSLSIILFIFFSVAAINLNSASASVKKKNKTTISKTKIKTVKTKGAVVKTSGLKSNNAGKKSLNNSGKNQKSKLKSNNKKVTKSLAKNKKNRAVSAKANNTKVNNINNENSDIRIRQVSGVVRNSIHKTISKMGLNKKLVNQLSSIFKNTKALSTLRKGDLIQVAYQEKYVSGKRVKTGVITAAIITSRKKSYQAYRFAYNGKHGYYDENGNSLESSFLKSPLKYREISSGFSTRRFHPIKHIYQPHPGIDYAAPTGTPVKSVGDGTVIFKGYASSAGNYMKIKHETTGISEYMHLSKFHKSMKLNHRVSKGDIIGYVGSTGYATGPHLDLRFMVNNKYVDYRKLNLPHGEPLPKKFRNHFFQYVALVNKQWNRTAKRELSFNSNTSTYFKMLN